MRSDRRVSVVRRFWNSLRQWLPEGGSLPEDEWQRRHKALISFLWINAAFLPVYGVVTGSNALHTVAHALPVAALALLAGSERLSTRVRSVLVSVGLLTSAALLVHLTGGLIEAHFYFFVLVVALTLYESWMPFLVAVAYVLLHHGVLGTISPEQVYNHPGAWDNPWLWAGVHALFVAMAGAAGILAWALNEGVRNQMRRTQHELAEISHTDSLTGLGNRRKAMADLASALGGNPGHGVVALFDLDGFKAYNDTFGHPAGDAMLARLGQRLAEELGTEATAYRLGGDEFLLLASDPGADRQRFEQLGLAALREHGRAFQVGSSCGSVAMPDEAATVSDVMHLADQRMYARKHSSRASAMSQSRDVLLQALVERYPDIGDHVDQVSGLVRPLGESVGMAEHEIVLLCSAAELHDIGKVAIPEDILNKPGPLDDEEWIFMRRHTLIGQRIVGAAPALGGVGEMIRSSHERWDGGGYPDGLAGDDIPLGSRIISVCDAYDAMTSDRPYHKAISSDKALEEMVRCSGTQFDSVVVTGFTRLVVEREAVAAAEARRERLRALIAAPVPAPEPAR